MCETLVRSNVTAHYSEDPTISNKVAFEKNLLVTLLAGFLANTSSVTR